MDNSALALKNMVTNQILPNHVTDPKLIAACAEIPRHDFVPDRIRKIAYIDESLPFGNKRHLLAPVTFTRMVQAANIQPTDKVLDVACMTGYSSAILSRLAKKVVALECDADMASKAHRLLKGFDIKNVIVIDGNLAEGHKEESPYNVIIINGAVPSIPKQLTDQLADNGRLVVIIQSKSILGAATIFEKHNGVISSRKLFETSLDVLPGFEKK